MRKLLVTGVVCLGVFLTGCPSVSTLGMARTLDKGQVQFALGPSAYGVVTPAGPLALPQVEVAAHYGVTDNIEIGGKAWFIGAAIDAKFSLLRSPTMDSGIDLAIDPGIGFLSVSGSVGGTAVNAGLITFYVPVLVGINLGGHQLILGPKLVDQLAFGGAGTAGGSGNLLSIGTSVGFAFKIGDNFRLLPEFSILYPVLNNTTVAGSSGVVFQAGLGFIFGGYAPTPTSGAVSSSAAP